MVVTQTDQSQCVVRVCPTEEPLNAVVVNSRYAVDLFSSKKVNTSTRLIQPQGKDEDFYASAAKRLKAMQPTPQRPCPEPSTSSGSGFVSASEISPQIVQPLPVPMRSYFESWLANGPQYLYIPLYTAGITNTQNLRTYTEPLEPYVSEFYISGGSDVCQFLYLNGAHRRTMEDAAQFAARFASLHPYAFWCRRKILTSIFYNLRRQNMQVIGQEKAG